MSALEDDCEGPMTDEILSMKLIIAYEFGHD